MQLNKKQIAKHTLFISGLFIGAHYASIGVGRVESFAVDKFSIAKAAAVDVAAEKLGLEKKQIIDPLTAVEIAEREALRFGLNPAIMRALVHIESRGDKFAESSVGARGAGQVMPANAKRCGLRPGQLFDPALNLKCSAQILSEEMKTYQGNVITALMAYNCSPQAVKAGKRECVEYASNVLNIAARDIR